MSTKKALMVWGGWEGHSPREAAELFAPWLEEQGYDVTVSDTLEAYEDHAMLEALDLVVPVWTQGTISVEQERNLLRAVWSGVGIAGWHGCMADSFRASTDYQFMVGGQWVAHPGNFIEHEVNVLDTGDPVTAGLSDFKLNTEQYYLHVDPGNVVLATTTFEGDHPVSMRVAVRLPVDQGHSDAGRVEAYVGQGPSVLLIDRAQDRGLSRTGGERDCQAGHAVGRQEHGRRRVVTDASAAPMKARRSRLRQHQLRLLRKPRDEVQQRRSHRLRRPGAGKGPGFGGSVRRTGRAYHGAAHSGAGRGAADQPHQPRGARGCQHGGVGGGQAGVQREATLGGTSRWQSDHGPGRGQGTCGGLCPGHGSGLWHPDLPQDHRRGADRRAGGGDGIHDEPRPRVVASGPGVLLQGWRRPDVRHGAVLSERPNHAAWACLTGHGFASQVRSTGARSRACQRGGRRSTWKCPRTLPVCSTSLPARSGRLITSFDVHGASLPRIEVYGSEATLCVPDPNRFDGPVSVIEGRDKAPISVPAAFPAGDRGLGASEMAWAVRNGRTPRASGALALHVLDVMHAVHEASDRGAHVQDDDGLRAAGSDGRMGCWRGCLGG